MELLLLLYAMIAGLTGMNAGPATVARLPAVAERAAAGDATTATQAAVALRALATRRAAVVEHPVAAMPDLRRVTLAVTPIILPILTRATPEQRRE